MYYLKDNNETYSILIISTVLQNIKYKKSEILTIL